MFNKWVMAACWRQLIPVLGLWFHQGGLGRKVAWELYCQTGPRDASHVSTSHRSTWKNTHTLYIILDDYKEITSYMFHFLRWNSEVRKNTFQNIKKKIATMSVNSDHKEEDRFKSVIGAY